MVSIVRDNNNDDNRQLLRQQLLELYNNNNLHRSQQQQSPSHSSSSSQTAGTDRPDTPRPENFSSISPFVPATHRTITAQLPTTELAPATFSSLPPPSYRQAILHNSCSSLSSFNSTEVESPPQEAVYVPETQTSECSSSSSPSPLPSPPRQVSWQRQPRRPILRLRRIILDFLCQRNTTKVWLLWNVSMFVTISLICLRLLAYHHPQQQQHANAINNNMNRISEMNMLMETVNSLSEKEQRQAAAAGIRNSTKIQPKKGIVYIIDKIFLTC